MLPLIVRTTPENGSTGIALDAPVVIHFAAPLAWDLLRASHFELRSVTANTAVALTGVTVNRAVFEVRLDHGGLQPLNRYRLVAAGLPDASRQSSPETYILEFETMAVDLTDPADPPFAQVFCYPWSGAQDVAPDAVRIRFSETLDKIHMNRDLTDPNCCLRVIRTGAYQLGEIFSLPGTIDPPDLARATDLVFRPDTAFDAGTAHTVLLQGVRAASGVILPDNQFHFQTRHAHAYVSIRDLSDAAPFLLTEIESLGEAWFLRKLAGIGSQLVTDLSDAGITYATDNVHFLDWIKAECACQVLLDRITDIATSASAKTLGDFQVGYTRSMDDLLKLLQVWRNRRDQDYARLAGQAGPTRSGTFVRGADADTAYSFMDRGLQSFDATSRTW